MLSPWLRNLSTDFTLNNFLFGSVQLTNNADLDKYKYSAYGIGFDSRSEISFTDANMGKNVFIFGAEETSQGLDDTALTAEAKYPIKFTQSEERFVLSLQCNGINSFLFVNAVKIYQFKAKDSEIKDYTLCLGNVSKDFTINNMKKKKQKKQKRSRNKKEV